MKRRQLPAWQQVLLVALESVPKAKNGQDAWDKLNEEEKAAVMDFLAEPGGEDAEARLRETCAIARPSRLPEWLQIIFGVGVAVAVYWLLEHVLERITWPDMPQAIVWVVEVLFWAMLIVFLFPDERLARMRQLWSDRAGNEDGPDAVLAEMQRVTQMTRWQALDKEKLVLQSIFYGILLAIRILNFIAFPS